MKQNDRVVVKFSDLTVDENSFDRRIDNFLFNKIKNVPKSRIYRMLRKGDVRVNKKRVSPSYKLQLGDLIKIPPFWSEEPQGVKKTPQNNLIKLLLSRIIFEDDRILVVNKPHGIASHGGSGINFGVIEILRFARPDLKKLELVHRLDRDTSGCVVLAKKNSSLRELHQLIREGKVFKKYILLVRGQWKNGERIVNAPLLKNQLHSGERLVKIDQRGKESITIFRPIKISEKMSLLEAELRTGRTHQIRVHITSIGYPIAGDEKYGDKKFNTEIKSIGLKRSFLHAMEVRFVWLDGTKVNLVANLDQELEQVLKKL